MSDNTTNDEAPLFDGAHINEPNQHKQATTSAGHCGPALRRDAAETSREAAERIAGHTGTQAAAVHRVLFERGAEGATDQEIQDATGLPTCSETPRRWAMVRSGLVVNSGTKRKTRSGCRAIVWQAREFAAVHPKGGAA